MHLPRPKPDDALHPILPRCRKALEDPTVAWDLLDELHPGCPVQGEAPLPRERDASCCPTLPTRRIARHWSRLPGRLRARSERLGRENLNRSGGRRSSGFRTNSEGSSLRDIEPPESKARLTFRPSPSPMRVRRARLPSTKSIPRRSSTSAAWSWSSSRAGRSEWDRRKAPMNSPSTR